MRSQYAAIALAVSLAACGTPEADNDPVDESNAMENASSNGETTVDFIDLRVEELEATRAVVRFDTSVPTSCEVEYGTTEDTDEGTATDPDMAEGELSEDHEVPLEDLEPETTYYWRARAETENGEVFFSEVQSFETSEAVEDNLPPLQNFAMDAAVMEVSSNFGGGDNSSTWGASNAFDGQMSTEWATNGDGDDAMVRVDLGETRKVTHFAFRSREMTDGTSIIESVQLSFDDGDPIGPFDTPDPDERYVFELETPQAGQAVLLEAVETTGGNTGAEGIEFLGTPKE